MDKPQRDYAAEYKRRIKRRLQEGYSRAQARGHARKHEVPLSQLKMQGLAKNTKPNALKKYYNALKKIRHGASFTKASKSVRLSPATLHKLDREREALVKDTTTGRYIVKPWAEFDVLTVSGQFFEEVLFDKLNASVMARYWNAEQDVRRGGHADLLKPFRRVSVVDVEGNRYRLMTNVNDIRAVFDQMSEGERDSFNEKLYRPLRHAA